MEARYAGNIYIDEGEKIHVICRVRPVCGRHIPFVISTAKWELYNSEGEMEAAGECTINGHELDIIIEPEKAGNYRLKYIYEVADETWIDIVRLRVS